MVFQTVIGGYSSIELVSWSNGSYSQIAAMLDAHYKGRINIANYWSVGDSRAITLDAISSNNVTDAMATQTAQLVLLNAGGKTLVTSQHGVSTCAYVVGFKNCLSKTGEFGSMNYSSSSMRSFLNNELYMALPSDLQDIMKYFVNPTTEKPSSSKAIVEVEDMVSLASANEVVGYPNNQSTLQGEGSQFSYYTTQANRVKNVDTTASGWWVRSAGDSYGSVSYVYSTGTTTLYSSAPSSDFGISPIFVI